MSRRTTLRMRPESWALAAAMLVAAIWTTWAVEPPAPPPNGDGQAAVPATTEHLGGASRYLTSISTDKPIYRPGETVFLRGVQLHHALRTPIGDVSQGVVEIRGPKGDVIAGGGVNTDHGVWGYSWTIPEGQSGGEYVVHVAYPFNGQPPAERKFDIRDYRAPRLKSQLKFLRDGYGPGDEAVVMLDVHRAEGAAPAGAKVTVIARVDGAEVHRSETSVDESGHAVGRFTLPTEIARGEGTVAMVIEDGGVVETASKTIPILLQAVDITLYPEGGELVQGVPCRVYFQAFTPAKKPADLAGVVVDADGQEVAEFRSEHEGRGRFTFTPKVAEGYRLRFTEPAGLKQEVSLPAAVAQGLSLRAEREVHASGEPIPLTLASPDSGKYVLTLRRRDIELARQEIELTGGEPQTIELTPQLPEGEEAAGEGVLIATAWQVTSLFKEQQAVAERLVFVKPSRSVRVEIASESDTGFVPGGKVRLNLRTLDEQGRPVKAQVGVTVTDDSVLEMVERREQTPRLPMMVLLEPEVQELADAQIYLSPDEPNGELAVDLLLGVQGWRRFAVVDITKFLADHDEAGRRALAVVRPLMIPDMAGGMGGFGGGGPFADNFAADGVRLAAPGAPPPPMAAAPANAPAPAGPEGPRGGAVPARAALPVSEAASAPGDAPADAAAAAGDDSAPAKDDAKQEAEQLARQDEARDKRIAEREVAQAANEEAPRAQLGQGLAGLGRPGGGPGPAGGLAAEPDFEFAGRRRALHDEVSDLQAVMARSDLVQIRQYAHEVRSGRVPGERVDFTETLFWAASVETDDSGEASVEFGLSDAVTAFRVHADAFDGRGALGAGKSSIESVEPFYVEPKLPLEVTMGDVVRAPVVVANASREELGEVTVDVESRNPRHTARSRLRTFAVPAGERIRKRLNVTVGDFTGEAEFQLTATAGTQRDQVTRRMRVAPLGFPIEDGGGALLQPNGVAAFRVEIPAELVPGSLRARAALHPTPLASMTAALERLIQEPYGCFEQTSSTTYPLVMAQQYFMSHQGVDPAVVTRAADTLERSYQRLIGFESPSHGFEWFGGDPGHDALTAYGLMEFTDMAQVRYVDPVLLARTRDWLLAQRDGQGGFVRKTHTLHTWLAEPEVAFPYDTWALVEAGLGAELKTEYEFAQRAGETSGNSYVTALAANLLASGGDRDAANRMMDKLAGLQEQDGSVSGATVSVVGSGGEALTIETTSLAVLAWLKNPSYTEQVEKGIKYLAEACQGGRYGSTQSTVLALKAIVAYDQSRARPKAPGQVAVWVDGVPYGEPVSFDEQAQGVIELPDVSAKLVPGGHTVELRMTDGSPMPCVFAIDYNSLKPRSSEDCKLHLEVSLRDKRIDEGATTEVQVVVVNRTEDKVPTPTVIVGIPGGLEVRHDQLKELVKQEKIAAYEVRGREVVLYWRALEAEQRVELPLSVIAAIPGSYTGPASRAYLYYTDEHKQWVDGLEATIE